MPRQTDNLGLILPLGSKYWNLETWTKNMEILDKAFTEIQGQIEARLNASNLKFRNTGTHLDSTNIQNAIPELNSASSSFRIIDVDENMNIPVSCTAHDYIILNFGSTAYPVSFTKNDPSYQGNITWLNGSPQFMPHCSYEISFLQLNGIWMEREEIDWKQFFVYYIENDEFHITRIKAPEWYARFGSYDFIIPSTIDDLPVILHV